MRIILKNLGINQSSEKNWQIKWQHPNCHTRSINDLLILTNKDIVLSASSDGSIAIWRLSSFSKLHFLPKAHEDSVQSLIYHFPSSTIISAGLDKAVRFWSIEERQTENIFGNVPVITENEEISDEQTDAIDSVNPRLTSLLELTQPTRNTRNERVGYELKKSGNLASERVIEMQMPENKTDDCFLLLANNKSIDRLTIDGRVLVPGYIRENEDIMTFCINRSGTLLITSIIGTFPCFHLWMIDHRRYIGENPFKMFSHRKFYWRTSKQYTYIYQF